MIRQHGPGVRRLAAGMLRDAAEAEDVAQETFLRVWRAAGRYDPARASAATWICRIALRLCIDRSRRSALRRFLGLEAAPDPAPDPADDMPGAEAALAARQDLARARTALRALPERQRRALLLRAAGGLSVPEIAAVLGLGPGAVEQLLVRARAGLRTRLKEMPP